MKLAIFGTGQVGSTIGGKLAALGHDVVIGSRTPGDDDAKKLAASAGVRVATHVEAAAHGEWIFNALPGEFALDTLKACKLDGRLIVDISNYNSAVDQPIAVPVGEAIQRAFPDNRVVKTLNSVSAHLMVDPAALGHRHSVFMAGNDEAAKADVADLLRSFGWQDIIDLGDITACRAMEQLIPLWMRLEQHFDGPEFNLAVIRP